ncbi:DUF7059 domain-containing protein, partial [Segeticoccus rhizosphaerae]
MATDTPTDPPGPPSRPGSAPPPHPDPARVASLRADLDAAGFTVEGLTELLGPTAARALRREQRLPADLATGQNLSPAATLVRLFALGLPVDPDRLATALPRLGVAGLTDLGLGAVEGGSVHARCDL